MQILSVESQFVISQRLCDVSDHCKDPRCYCTPDHDRSTLPELLFPVITEILPAGTAFCFRKIMLEEMCFSQKDIVEANNAAVSGIIFTSID